jgi:peptidoglycan-N-acetylglucosamine deacetylase
MSAAFTIDVDGLACYHDIHGLPAPNAGTDPIYSRALPRFLCACESLGVRATLFVVGKDLEQPAHRAVLARAVRAGHEVASHSYAHDYRLSRLSPADIARDLEAADEAILDATGARPVGFRAPGYNQSEALFDALEARGYRYDSSFFPTPAYFAARGLALGLYKLRRRPSRSLLGEVREFASSRAPFYPAATARYRPARRGERARSFVEIPMSVASPLRLPWLGTTLALAHDRVGAALTSLAVRSPGPCVLELHAIDFLGAGDGVLPSLVGAQPDLRVALDDKLRRLEAALTTVSRARSVVTMAEIASTFG